jgi:hypothetical protein
LTWVFYPVSPARRLGTNSGPLTRAWRVVRISTAAMIGTGLSARRPLGRATYRSPGLWESAYRRIRGYSSAQIMNMSMAIITIAQTG